MKNYLISTLLLLTFAAQAQYAGNSQATKYSMLEEMYIKSGKPSLALMTPGWHSGRCYDSGDPNRPMASLLVFEPVVDPKGDNGPLFPRPLGPQKLWSQLFTDYFKGQEEANYYDHVDQWNFLKESIQYELSSNRIQHIQLMETSRSLLAYVKDSSGKILQVYRIKENQDYYFMDFIQNSNGRLCYYFKQSKRP